MQKSGPFNLKYVECGSDGICKYSWVLHEKQFWIQPAEDFLGAEILRAASKLHSRVRSVSFILDNTDGSKKSVL